MARLHAAIERSNILESLNDSLTLDIKKLSHSYTHNERADIVFTKNFELCWNMLTLRIYNVSSIAIDGKIMIFEVKIGRQLIAIGDNLWIGEIFGVFLRNVRKVYEHFARFVGDFKELLCFIVAATARNDRKIGLNVWKI